MESTPLRDAVLKTRLDLTLSGIGHTRYRNYSFETDPKSPISLLRTPTNFQRRMQPKILPAIPTLHNQKTPVPKRSSSSPTRQSTLDRRNNNNNILRKSGSLSDLPTCVVTPIIRHHKLFSEYSVGQPVLKVPRTPHYTAQPIKYKTLDATATNSCTFHSSPKGSSTPFTSKRILQLNLETQRVRVTREIMETEETYIKSLRTLTSFFYRPLQKGNLLPTDDLKQLFPPQLNSLLICHTDLLDKLNERLSNPKFRGIIGDLFSDLCPGSMSMDFFQMYSGYVQAFPAALSVYDKHIRANKEFRGFIRACMESPSCRGLDLCAFLLTPIQRLPRYLLLLTELSKYTSPTHPDWYFASLASDNFKACLVLLNGSIHHVLQVAAHSDAWQCQSQTKNSRSTKQRKSSKRASKTGIARAVSNSDLDSNVSTIRVESCPPSTFTAKCHRLPVPPQRARVTSAEEIPKLSDPPVVSLTAQTDSGIYEDDPDDFVPPKTILETSESLLESTHTTRVTSRECSLKNEPKSDNIEPRSDKRHMRRRSADRIFRLFRIFRSK